MTENRHALIIASYQYQDPDLRQLVAPAQDAEDLARVLRDPAIGGFDQVETSINQPSHDVRRAIACFFAQGTRKDLLLLYFSGHGLLDAQGHLYLAAQDTERDLLSATAIPAAFVSTEMDRSRSRRQVLVLDCCHSGAFDRGTKGATGARVGTAAAFEGTGYGRVVLTATDSTQYAWEGDQVIGQADHSVFTHYLVHGLQTGEADSNANGLITLDELYDYVYAQVVRETPRQTPGKWTYKQQGEILIARNPALAVSASLLPGWITEALASGASSARLAVVGELTHLSQGRDRDLAAIARVELERLSREDEHPAVRGAAADVLGTAPISVQTPRDAPPPPAPRITPRKTEPTRPQPETAGVLDTAPTSMQTPRETSPPHRVPRKTPRDARSSSRQYETEQYKVLSPDRILWKRDGKEMVRIPAGKFLYGGLKKERELPEYWIDKTPVTNAEYARFVKATGYQTTAEKQGDGTAYVGGQWQDVKGTNWRHPGGPETDIQARMDHPVVQVSWHDVIAYAEWAGKRLPTEEEWEKAARGTDGRKYTWGDQWPTPKLCNFDKSNVGDTTPVGKYSPSGDSPYSCVDMAGNVWEWTASDYDKDHKVLRGGSFNYPRRSVCSTARRKSYYGYTVESREFTLYGFRMVAAPFSQSAQSVADGSPTEIPDWLQEITVSRPSRSQPETAQYKLLSPDRILWKKDSKEMVRVPAGKFLYGDKETERDLPKFWIDKTPVTNAEYARFVAAAGHKPPSHWKGKIPPKKIATHPVVSVSWHDAVAYAEWAGKRLPIEEEWEKAARGADGREYPWGNQQPMSELCNFGMKVGDTTAVGKYSPGGDSPYGCVDMAGNVWEWTASEWEGGSDRRVLYGGSFDNNETNVRASYRVNNSPISRGNVIGFRCVGVAPGQ